jgi:DNA-binding CsgD family transcriptional regulator
LLAELGRHVGFDAACSATLDPVTAMWTSCEVMGGRRDLEFEARLFDVEYRRPDVAKLVDIARRAQPFAVLSVETGGDLARSERYRAVHSPAGLGDEIRLLLRDGGLPWGCVHLTRALGSKPFELADGEALAALSAPLARSYRHALLRMAMSTAREAGPRAIGVLSMRGTTLVEANTEARGILGAALDTTLPAAAHGVIALARAGLPARASCPTAAGEWATLHATRLGGEVAIIVERSSPVELLDLVVHALGLSERERSVVHTVARGLSTKEIALELGISDWTVQDHLKSIFAKANVTSRQALVAALFFGYWAPQHERGATPSPYGHYLRGGEKEPR